MSQQHNAAASADRKRVKVYELKNNDWYDRGTGFCTGHTVPSQNATPDTPDAHILVVSEDDPNRTLLETRITRDDGYQKQQDTLIVWTESNGVDMALSFQEAEGCASIWEFVSEMQGRLAALAPDDGLSDDLLDPVHSVALPEPQLGKLEEVEQIIRAASASPAGRDALVKFIMHPEHMYIMKLAPLVSAAEEMESTADLHRLCTIMKHLILLNDTAIIEFVVTDRAIMGVVGALEYDPDFPSHRANHRQYLSDSSKFKEVVPIREDEIKRKIHWTYRLLYLKDVVLARILDDPTFSVLNSLIFFHQVDIVNHLQNNKEYLEDLFNIFRPGDGERHEKKKEAVQFIQNCCAVSKNTQAQSRAQLYQNFIHHGLFAVLTFALRHHDAGVRVAGTDILVALIDHDAQMVRNHIFTSVKEKTVPLTDTLIELLLVEVDLGVKSQMADAIKVLLDPSSTQPGAEMMNRTGASNEMLAKQRAQGAHLAQQPQTNQFLDSFYESSAKRLFAPLKALERRSSMSDLTVQETSLFTHLVEVMSFFVRSHSFRGRTFILGENLHSRVAQLLSCPQKHVKLSALKWFRICVGLGDQYHNRQMMQNELFESILSIVEATMPRDNLLNSACLELFEYIRREHVKQLIDHLVEQYRERLLAINYVNTFHDLVARYDTMKSGYHPGTNGDDSTLTTDGTPTRMLNGRQGFAGLREMDNDEEAYFNTDDEIEEDEALPTKPQSLPNGLGASPVRPLVSYPEDDDDDDDGEARSDDPMSGDLLASSPDPLKTSKLFHPLQPSSSPSSDCNRPLPANSSDSTTASTTSEDPFSHLHHDPDSMDFSTSEPTTVPSGAAADGLGPHDLPPRSPTVPSNAPPEPPREVPSSPAPIKRRRPHDEEEDDDALDKMMGAGVKRRNSTAKSVKNDHESGAESANDGDGLVGQAQGRPLRRKGGFVKAKDKGGEGSGGTKVAITLGAVRSPTGSHSPRPPEGEMAEDSPRDKEGRKEKSGNWGGEAGASAQEEGRAEADTDVEDDSGGMETQKSNPEIETGAAG